MHLLAYWRLDNYLRDLDEGAGFNFNSRQARLHTAIELGESLWLFTVCKNPPRFFIVARLVIRSKTMNPPGYRYGDYRVWGDFVVRPENETTESRSEWYSPSDQRRSSRSPAGRPQPR